MSEQPEAKALDDLRAAVRQMNTALAAVTKHGIHVSVDMTERSFLSQTAPSVAVTARATRSRIEIDERF